MWKVCLPNVPETEAFHPGVSSGEVGVEGMFLHSRLPAPCRCYSWCQQHLGNKLLNGGCPPARLGSAHAVHRRWAGCGGRSPPAPPGPVEA